MPPKAAQAAPSKPPNPRKHALPTKLKHTENNEAESSTAAAPARETENTQSQVVASEDHEDDEAVAVPNPKKSKKNKAHVNLETLVPQVKVYNDTKKNELKAIALASIRDNPKSGLNFLRVIDLKNMESNATLTAGYFGFHDTMQMKVYAAEENIQDILQDFKDAKNISFGMVTKSNTQDKFMPVKFYSELFSATPDKQFYKDIHAKVHVTDGRYGAKGAMNVYENYAVVCLRILECPPDDDSVQFPRGGCDLSASGRFMGYTWEDWSRALTFVRWHLKESLPSRQKTSTKTKETAASRAIATLPVYLTEEELFTTAPDDAEMSDADGEDDSLEARNRKYQHRYYKAIAQFDQIWIEKSNFEQNVHEALGLDLATIDSAEFLKHIHVLEDTLLKLYQKRSNKIQINKTKEVRPLVGLQDVMDFCDTQYENATILWGEENINAQNQAALNAAGKSGLSISNLISMGVAEEEPVTGLEKEDVSAVKEDDALRDMLLNVRSAMGSQSSLLPSFKEACKWANLDPENLEIKEAPESGGKKYMYKPHQPVVAYGMAQAEKSAVRGSIVGVACGLGKTLTTLLAIKTINEAERNLDSEKSTYAASLVICPGGSVEVWQADIEKFFPNVFTVHQFYGTSVSVKDPKRKATLIEPPLVEGLNKLIKSFDPKEPKTGLTLVLTAHSTWFNRTIGTVGGHNLAKPLVNPEDEEPELEASTENLNVEDDDEDQHSLEPGQRHHHPGGQQKQKGKTKKVREVKEKGRVYTTRCTYTWARVVVDEAHALRNPNTLLAESIFQTRKKAIHFLTATPMLNHPKDLAGFLQQLWNQEWGLLGFHDCGQEMYEDGFDPRDVPFETPEGSSSSVCVLPARDKSTEALWRSVEKGEKLYALDPWLFKRNGRTSEWNAEICSKMMPTILRMILLKVGYETEIDLQDGAAPVRVGASVPRCNFYSIQLKMHPMEKKLHDDRTLHLLAMLGVGETMQIGDSRRAAWTAAELSNLEAHKESEGIIHPGVYRMLKHATLDPRLAQLTELNHRDMSKQEKDEAAKNRVNNWTGVDFDHGASMFFARTRDGPQYSPPIDRLSLAKYLCYMSVKVRFALGKIAENRRNHQKTILVFEYPMPLWLVETQLENLCISYVALKSNFTQEERAKIISDFNDKTSGIDVLLLTTALGAVSLNLQEASACIIVMEIPINFYTLMQVLGRINRIGQELIQRVYLLWIDHSYDQICLNRIFRKIVPSLCGEGDAATADDPEKAAQTLLQLFMGINYNHTPLDESWSSLPYEAKDRHSETNKAIRASAASADEDESTDEDESADDIEATPSANTGAPYKKNRQFRRRNVAPKQNIVDENSAHKIEPYRHSKQGVVKHVSDPSGTAVNYESESSDSAAPEEPEEEIQPLKHSRLQMVSPESSDSAALEESEEEIRPPKRHRLHKASPESSNSATLEESKEEIRPLKRRRLQKASPESSDSAALASLDRLEVLRKNRIDAKGAAKGKITLEYRKLHASLLKDGTILEDEKEFSKNIGFTKDIHGNAIRALKSTEQLLGSKETQGDDDE